MLILYFSWDGLRGKRLGFWVYLEVKTVGTAVPGTAMSTVQEVKAENTDFNPETYMTSADWMNKFDEIFHTLFVGADKQIVADNQYIIPLAKGDELPQDPEAVKAAILGQLTEEELAVFNSDHTLSVEILNQYAVYDVDTWQVKITVVYDKDLDQSSGDVEQVKDELEKAENTAANTPDGETTEVVESGKGLSREMKQAIDLTDSKDMADKLEELAAADQLPAMATPDKDENGDYILESINTVVEEAYQKALDNFYTGQFSDWFTAHVSNGQYTNLAPSFIEDGAWHGFIVIENNDKYGVLQANGVVESSAIEVVIELSTFDNGEQAIADAIEANLENEPVYMPYSKSFLVGNGYSDAVETMLLGKTYYMLQQKYPGEYGKLEVSVVNSGKLTKTGDHTAVLQGASIKFKEESWDYFKTIELADIEVEEDVVDGIDLTTTDGADVKTEFEIGGNGLKDSNIASANIRSSHVELWKNVLDALLETGYSPEIDLYEWFQVPYEDFETGSNQLFTVDDGGFNVNKLGAYTYTLTSNDTRTPVEGNVSLTYNVVKTITKLQGTYAAVSSSDENVAKIAEDGTITAYAAGTSTITLTNTAGKVVQYTLTVSERGNYDLEQVKTTEGLTIANNSATIGFVYHPELENYSYAATNHEVSSAIEESDEVISVTYDEDNASFTLKPLAEGTADVVIKGGKYGRLETVLHVSVDKFNGVDILSVNTNVKAYKLNAEATSTLQNTPIYENDYVNVENFEFGSEDYLILSLGDGNFTTQDAVPASDLQAVYVDTVHGCINQNASLYYGNSNINYSGDDITVKVLGKVSLGIADLGIVPANIEVIEGDTGSGDETITTEYASYEVVDGALVIKSVGHDGTGKNKLLVTDEFGNEATVYVNASTTAEPYAIEVTQVDKYVISDNEIKALVTPDKTSYFIGEELDVTGGEITFNNVSSIPLRDYMVTGFDSSKAVQKQTLTVAYGDSGLTYDVRIKARVENVSLDSLGLDASDIKTVSTTGDKEVTAKLNGNSIEISAMAINQSSAAIIETTSGNKLAIRITVDENGEISTETVKTFKSSTANIANNEDTLRIIATTASSDNAEVATAKISRGNIVITSVAPGTATVTVADGDKEAKIAVTVDEFGNIATVVTKYNPDGWKKVGDNDWAYYKDGEMVVSDWVCVEEADPYNNNEVGEVWYHFGSDGLMQRGWIVDETGWKIYLLDSNGRMMHSQWVNAPAQESLNRPAGIYRLTDDGAVQMNGWATSIDNENIEWFCNAGNGLFEVDNPASWRVVG